MNMMKQDQEKRHFCKLCNKSFTSGKVLGGHMRSHLAKKNSTKTEKKLNKITMDYEGGGGAFSYGLRENPKKSWKFSGSEVEEGVPGQENLCKICGKGFASMRALFGHMRHHSGKKRKGVIGLRCKECDQEFESLRALTGHMKSHHAERIGVSKKSTAISTSQKLFGDSQYGCENSGLIRRKKRSRRLRYKVSPNSSFANNLSENSSYVTESEQEVVEVAVTLLMLSRGVRNRDGFSSVTESSDNNSATFEAKSANQTHTLVTNGGGNYVSDDDDEAFKMKKPRLEKLKVSEFSENDSGFVSDEGKIVKLEVSIDRFYKGVAYKMPNLDDDDTENKNGSHEGMRMMNIINPFEVELHENFTEGIRLDQAGLGSLKSGLRKKARIGPCFDQLIGSPCGPSASEIFDGYGRKNEYKCRICSKIFHSHQALGGHQTIHRPAKNCHALQIDDHPESFCNTKTFSEIEAASKVGHKSEFNGDSMVEMDKVTVMTSCESKEHKCPICFKIFASGQALGGHKRAHFAKDSEAGEEQISLLNQELSDICDKVIGFDVRIEDEAKADVELKSWWVKNDQKHELLLGLIPN
ncbi:hypothetical protein FEM48_Zijuj04G0050800 [Ziziphus jujuba var. spinosa]|uniref:C2H2-type domain-containing protein n=1 Tax=Ziziphus jujuba var. spinosa TaxID=714518 RepID=A0A978VHY7_ZIZJJ|nr:hypothetical protein FEM48_Zijuj04G0050800 [Ziziphus jujuba var. spinosa]